MRCNGHSSRSPLSASIAAGMALVPFFAVARMATAEYALHARLADVRALALLTLAALVLRYLFVAAAHMAAHAAAFRVLYTLRVQLAHELGRVPLTCFADHDTGHLKRVMMDDVGQLESFIAHNLPDGVAALVVPLSTAIALAWVDWRMALASLVVAPLAITVMAIAMRDVGRAHAQWNTLQDRTSRSLLEYLRGIHVIKTFGLTARRFGDLALDRRRPALDGRLHARKRPRLWDVQRVSRLQPARAGAARRPPLPGRLTFTRRAGVVPGPWQASRLR